MNDIHPLFLVGSLVLDAALLSWLAYEWWSVRPNKNDSAEAGHAEGQHGADERRP